MAMVRFPLLLLRWSIILRSNMGNVWKHPTTFWHWSITWPWFAVLFLGGVGVVAVNEPIVGLGLIFLSLFSLTSKLWHTDKGAVLKALGTMGIIAVMVLCVMSAIAYVEERPWSNIVSFWKRFVILNRLPPIGRSPKYPPRFEDFPPTSVPVPKLLNVGDEGAHITVEIGPSPEPNYAYETRFILKNLNPSEITDGYYSCETQKVDKNAKLPGLSSKIAPAPSIAFGTIENLLSGDSHSIYCDFTADLWANELERPELNLWIFYNYRKQHMKRGFKFLAIPTQDGKHNFVWLPRGQANEMLKP
jgi:hypothetical protein